MEKLRINENKIIENREKNKLKNFEHNDIIFFKQKDKSKIGIGRIINFNTELKLNNINLNSNKKVSLANYLKILNNLSNSKYVYSLINSLSKDNLDNDNEDVITNEKNVNKIYEKKERNILSYFSKKERNVSNSSSTLKKNMNGNHSYESEKKIKQNGKVSFNSSISKTKLINEERKKSSKVFYIIQSFETYKYLIQYKKAFKHYKVFFHKKWESIKTSYCKNLQNEITFELAMKLFEIKKLYANNKNLQNIMINNLIKIYRSEKHFHADYFFLNLIKKIDVRIILQNNVLLTNDDINDMISTYDKNKKETNEKIDHNTSDKCKINNVPEKSTQEKYANQNDISNCENEDEKSAVEDLKIDSNNKKTVRKKIVEGECFQYELKGNLLANFRSSKGVIYRGFVKNLFKNKNTILSYFLIIPSFFWFNDSYYFSCLNIDIDIFEILEIIKKIDNSKKLYIDNISFVKYQNYQNLKKSNYEKNEKEIQNILKEEKDKNMLQGLKEINEEKEEKNEEQEFQEKNGKEHKQDKKKQERKEKIKGNENEKKTKKKRKKDNEQNKEEKKKEKDEKIKKRKKVIEQDDEIIEKEKKVKGRKKEQKEVNKEKEKEKEKKSKRKKKEKEAYEEEEGGENNFSNKTELKGFYKKGYSLDTNATKEDDNTHKKSTININYEGKNSYINKITDFFKISENNKQKLNNTNEEEFCQENEKNEKKSYNISNENKSLNNENENINSNFVYYKSENINNKNLIDIDENTSDKNKNKNINNKNENTNNNCIEDKNINNKNENTNNNCIEDKNINNESENINNKNENINTENENINIKNENTNIKNESITTKNENITIKSESITTKNENITIKNENINIKNENINIKNENVNIKNQSINIENEYTNNKIANDKDENINDKNENANKIKKDKDENIDGISICNEDELLKLEKKENCLKIENNLKYSNEYINKDDKISNNNYTLKIYNDIQTDNNSFLKNRNSEYMKRLIEIEKIKKIEMLYRYCKEDINILLYIYVMHIYINKLCKHVIVKVLNPKCKNLKKKKYEDRDFILTPLIGYSYANFYYLKLNKMKKKLKTDKKIDKKNYKLINQKLIKKERKRRKKNELKSETDIEKKKIHSSSSSDSSFKSKILKGKNNPLMKDVNKKLKKMQITKCSKKNINLYLWGIFNWNYKKTLRISFNNISNRKISNYDVYNFFFYNYETLSDLSEIDKDLNKLINIYKNIKTILYQNSSIYGDLFLLKVKNNLIKTNSDEELINFWLKTLDELYGIKEGFYKFF
ncbi:conserved Plasmodium protein, unknown function [Plasmodium relictum]|uniref:Uncharacterized protein n=1 Tax=Plasmodium relictum TaxID=85471 RepID=A0A1J1HDU7_PLARL|nr:conserved Plasmodium protein, unknown function [Plasmodium relictum]CRH04108.1 conserved Plasmodium protein, unknown function [Plasmodium relictum]